MSDSKVTIKIPRALYERIQVVIKDSGFSSPTDFIVFVLRDLVGGISTRGKTELTDTEIKSITEKLRNLGYID